MGVPLSVGEPLITCLLRLIAAEKLHNPDDAPFDRVCSCDGGRLLPHVKTIVRVYDEVCVCVQKKKCVYALSSLICRSKSTSYFLILTFASPITKIQLHVHSTYSVLVYTLIYEMTPDDKC